jgi:uncharacterized protein with HEPN domain
MDRKHLTIIWNSNSFGKFKRNKLVIDGVVRNLEIIGEAAKNVPANVRNKAPDVEWKKISGLRDVLAHEYFGVDIKVLWDIVTNNLPDPGLSL